MINTGFNMDKTIIFEDWGICKSTLNIFHYNGDYVCKYAIEEYEGDVELCNIFVSPTYRGRGLCKMMIEEFMTNDYGTKEVYLIVRKDNNKAIQIYKEFGFEYTEDKDEWVQIMTLKK